MGLAGCECGEVDGPCSDGPVGGDFDDSAVGVDGVGDELSVDAAGVRDEGSDGGTVADDGEFVEAGVE